MSRSKRAVPRHSRLDPPTPAQPPAPHGEVKAVQVDRAVLVKTRAGEQMAMTGEWLVTEADGTVQVFSDRAFRLQALRQQLVRMLAAGHGKSKRA
jgi:hypothetical protein